jgi:uncharacterized protein (DUF488 family)
MREGGARILTLGYTGLKMEQIRQLVEERDAVVVDCRLRPFSRAAVWNRQSFQRSLGGRYVHVPALGNRNYRNPEAGVELNAPGAAVTVVEGLLERYGAVVLMCVCAEWGRCHRKEAAEFLVEALGGGLEVEHVRVEPEPRGPTAPRGATPRSPAGLRMGVPNPLKGGEVPGADDPGQMGLFE